MLPLSFVSGLCTAVQNSGLEVVLLAYGPVANVPVGVTLEDCEPYMPRAEFDKLSGRVPVQCLADLVRARALLQGVCGDHSFCVFVCVCVCARTRG